MPAQKQAKTAKKKPVAKKATAKKTVATVHHRPFMQAKFTEQTIYWIVIGVAVVALAAWVLSLQVQLNEMYDRIELETTVSYR